MIRAYYSMRQPRNYASIYSSVSATTHYTNYTRSNGLWSEVVASHTYNLTHRIPECFPGFHTQMRLSGLIYKLVIKLNTPFICTTKWNLVVHFTERDHLEQILFWEAFWIPCNLHFTNLRVGQMSPRMNQFDACANPNSSTYFASKNIIALYIILPSYIIPIWHIRTESDNSCSEMASIMHAITTPVCLICTKRLTTNFYSSLQASPNPLSVEPKRSFIHSLDLLRNLHKKATKIVLAFMVKGLAARGMNWLWQTRSQYILSIRS